MMIPKADSSVTPATRFTDGLTDQGAPSSTSQLVYPSDSRQLMESWTIVGYVKKVLLPGQSCIQTYTHKPFKYSFAYRDQHNLEYQKKFGGFAFCQRIQGVLGHDTSADEQGFVAGEIDASVEHIYKFEYFAGKDLNDISVSDSADTFTNTGVVAEPLFVRQHHDCAQSNLIKDPIEVNDAP